ncbi:unnamed protein product [Protopolystoma xenopodis]|uniref:Uncharacterized protein n=1 Tax=Protopolystoma xenopodis TaxID=117903 RepID=A0A3S5AJX6_9PLAT|nr:unnamed protein product [Protopolystoma xenopodis]
MLSLLLTFLYSNQALDGPHHYQIANHGGLIVAIPADILWPEVLRFSTDAGLCWHSVPLHSIGNSVFPDIRPNYSSDQGHNTLSEWPSYNFSGLEDTGQMQPFDSSRGEFPTHSSFESTNPINLSDSSFLATLPFLAPREALSSRTHRGSTIEGFKESRPGLVTVNPTEFNLPSQSRLVGHAEGDETVVFTGLVTEPGGKAMAVAVYGYGAATQRWRVAVIDLIGNEMVTRNCN